MKEPQIVINGILLTESQSMTIRVAVESFATDLVNGLGEDEIGKNICQNYKDRISEIRTFMYKK
jgi:hypothetical protein